MNRFSIHALTCSHGRTRYVFVLALLACFASALLLAGCGGDDDDSANAKTKNASTENIPPIKHVFIIVLENKGFKLAFGPNSKAPYLANTLTSKGMLLTQYYGVGHFSNDNYIAMISGQAPNIATQMDCRRYSKFKVKSPKWAKYGQIRGTGCVYPPEVKTIADQLTAAGLTWKGYMEDMGNNPKRDGGVTCAHPEIGAPDKARRATVKDAYATRHNPFVYFQSIIGSSSCHENVVPLQELKKDLTNNTVPNYAFIVPNLCHDGHNLNCVDGKPGGLRSINQFLETWVPRIMSSMAYQNAGLLIITFDESDIEFKNLSDENGDGQITLQEYIDAISGPPIKYGACCGEKKWPGVNKQLGGQPGIIGPGGGRIGTVLLSPFIKPGTTNDTPFNHYSLLRSIEDIFGLKHLGYAQLPMLTTFAEAGLYQSET